MAKSKGGGGGGKSSAPVARVTQTSNSNNPSAGTRTVTPINGATQAQANRAVAKSEQGDKPKANLASAGSVLSRKEAEAIADRKGQTVAQVMAAAQGKGLGFTAGLVNNFNSGNLGANLQTLGNFGGIPYARGQNAGTTQALQSLQALQGLRMQPKTVYAGYSTTTRPGQSGSDDSGSWHTPGSTTYNPIVVPKGVGGFGGGGGGGGAGGQGGAGAGGVKNDGSFESIQSLYKQQFADAEQAAADFRNQVASQIETMQLDFAQQLADSQTAADQEIGYLNDLMMMQQQQAASTQSLLQQQAQAAQAAYAEQARQAQALSQAYVPNLEGSAASVQLGDQRTTQRETVNNSLSSLAIASPGLGTNLNPLAGLQLA